MRKLMAALLACLERCLDDSVDSEELKRFLQKKRQKHPAVSSRGPSSQDLALDTPGFGFLQSESVFTGVLHLCENTPTLMSAKMEALLRHVEIRRKGCFRTAHTTSTQLWRVRHRAAILLCAFAGQEKDARFLNAALKLNDWAFPRYKNGFRRKELPLYLDALQAAETALLELFP